MARSIINSKEIVERVVAILRQQLPVDWTSVQPTDVPLTAIQPGDLMDHAIDDVAGLSPIVLVRSMGVSPGATSGLAGLREMNEMLRIVHVRSHDHCRTTAGELEHNVCRARYRYAAELCSALFSDPHGRLALIDDSGNRTDASLTSDDAAGAQVIMTHFLGIDYGGGTDDTKRIQAMGAKVWATALDLRVHVRCGGEN